jgi:hypothetical protein
MARLTFAVHDSALMFALAVMAPEAIVERSGAEIRAFRILGIPWLIVGRHMPARYDNRIALDRTVMHDA